MDIGLSEDFDGWPPEQTVFHVAKAAIRVLPGEHPLFQAEREAIAENWEREVKANPALFDGRMLLQHRVGFDGNGLVSEGHVISYSTFLWWRKQTERRGGIHVYAYPVLETSDGALVAIRMGSHTANPGMVYFACGSLDLDDVKDGWCDPDHNMLREVLEETGLDLRQAKSGSGYQIAHYRRAVTLFRVFRFDLSATEMIARIEHHMEVGEDKEIAGAVAICSADPNAHPYNVGMLPVLDWYFNSERKEA